GKPGDMTSAWTMTAAPGPSFHNSNVSGCPGTRSAITLGFARLRASPAKVRPITARAIMAISMTGNATGYPSNFNDQPGSRPLRPVAQILVASLRPSPPLAVSKCSPQLPGCDCALLL